MGHDPIPIIGVIITNRDRTATLRPCLRSLAGQSRPPRWVAIADLGSECSQAVRLERLAQDFGVSYLRLEDPGEWIKGLAFNTALRRMPDVPFILQLDADVVVHPHLIELSERALTHVDCIAYVASYADELDPTYDGSLTAYARLLAKARCVSPWAFGGSYLLPRSWLLSARGMDESYCGWGFADGDLWCRARRKLRAYEELTGSFAVHQPHARQPGASVYRGNPNWQRYLDRRDGLEMIVNRNGFGAARQLRAVLRPGLRRRTATPARFAPPQAVRTMREGQLKLTLTASQPESAVVADAGLFEMFRVSVVLSHGAAGPAGRKLCEQSLAAQTSPPAEVIVADDDPVATVRRTRASSTHVLIAQDDLILQPHALQALRAAAARGYRLVHGYRHEIPFMAGDLGLLGETAWQAWGATVFVLSARGDYWLLAERQVLMEALDAGLADAVARLTSVRRADRLRLGPTFVLGFRYPRRQPDRDRSVSAVPRSTVAR